MLTEVSYNFSLFTSLLPVSLFFSYALALPDPSGLRLRRDNPVDTEDPLRNSAYLPAQIGGIVGAYAVSLVLVAITLLALSKKRRDHLNSGHDEIDLVPASKDFVLPVNTVGPLGINTQVPPVSTLYLDPYAQDPYPQGGLEPAGIYIHLWPVSTLTIGQPGVSPAVDQRVVAFDKAMAQNQLEEMYKHVMEHEAAKQHGAVYEAPIYPHPTHQPRSSVSDSVASHKSQPRKERFKPANLNLSRAGEEKTQSRTSSLFSALRSPRKKHQKEISISSPIMTPQSATFPRHAEMQEMNQMPPRQYAPPPPPPIPMDQIPYGASRGRVAAPITPPDISPQSVQSIHERIEAQLPPAQGEHTRSHSLAPTEGDPQSATSDRSTSALVGLPQSPKPGSRFPSLPSSPKPGATFRRPNAPTAVRTGGSLPLRAYDTGLGTPTHTTHTTKQTVFERRGPLSPSGNMTPYTAGVPYTPYQPFTPVVPLTPSLVTKEDRKRMKRMVPKTPIMEMVKRDEDVW